MATFIFDSPCIKHNYYTGNSAIQILNFRNSLNPDDDVISLHSIIFAKVFFIYLNVCTLFSKVFKNFK